MTARKSFSVRKRSVEEAMLEFPAIRPVENLECNADVLVLAAGFEERVRAFPELLNASPGSRFKVILVGRYQTNPEDNDLRFNQVEPLLRQMSSDIRYVDADVPEDVLRSVLRISESINPSSILFDISGASSSFIFSVLGSLSQVLPDVSARIVYAEAARYSVARRSSDGDEVLEAPELGVATVWNNAVFPGRHQDSAGSHIIAFPSHSVLRVARCLNFCGEAVETLAERNVLWVLPRTTNEEHIWRRQETIEVIRKLMAQSDVNSDCGPLKPSFEEAQVDCETHSPADAARIVLREADARSGQNLYLVHMGSKLQAVGAAFAVAARSEISVVHARPQKFVPSAYSDGIGRKYIIDIGDVGAMVKNLSAVGQAVLVCADGSEES